MDPDPNQQSKIEFLNSFGLKELPEFAIAKEEPVAVVLAFNEILRFPYFLEHYRRIGVKHFVVIDNNSTDGTAAYLDRQPDVVRILTKHSYKEYKSVWRQVLCDLFFKDRWVLFPDVDEILIYPGWPELKLTDLVRYLDLHGYGGLFTTMVDMYPKGALSGLRYESGTSFIDACAYFDSTGYRYVPLKGANGRAFAVPSRHVYGGTRERLFHHNAKRKTNLLDRFLLSSVYSIHSNAPSTGLGRYIDRKLFKLVRGSLPGVDPLMSKVPLVKWIPGISFSGGVHSVSGPVKLAPDWGALLHFKYLGDFSEKVLEAIERKQHAVGSRFYRDYKPHLDKVMNEGAFFEGSQKFTSEESLLEHGLMRKSWALSDFLRAK